MRFSRIASQQVRMRDAISKIEQLAIHSELFEGEPFLLPTHGKSNVCSHATWISSLLFQVHLHRRFLHPMQLFLEATAAAEQFPLNFPPQHIA